MDLKGEIMYWSALHGVSGCEGAVSALLAERLRPLTDSVRVDAFGNVVGCRKNGREGAPKLMLDAHIDQTGLMVKEVTDDGFVRFTSIGVDTRALLSDAMVVLTRDGPLKGVISAIPPHLQSEGDDRKPVPVRDMTLDLGFSGDTARRKIRPGDPITFDAAPVELLNGFIAGPALDNRAGVAVLIRVLEALKGVSLPCDLVVTGTTRKESGFHGISQCVRQEQPDYVFVVDAIHARTGDGNRCERGHPPGGGPVIGRGANSSPRLADRLIEVAAGEGLDYRLEAVPRTSGTNAWAAQVAGRGSVTAVVSLPVKYRGTPVEVLCLDDAAALENLLCSFCCVFGGLTGRRPAS